MKTVHRIRLVLTTLLLAALIIPPLIRISFTGAVVSEVEQRRLADYPYFGELRERVFNRDWMNQMENWLNDHIGLRGPLWRIYTRLMHERLGISTVASVIRGQNGWLYYTLDHNLDIIKGTYPLDEQMTGNIITGQKTLSDWYASRGIHYALLLTPSKVSVYPAYLPFEFNPNIETPSKILEKRLKESNACNVFNAYDFLLDNHQGDNEALLFYKTDTHWTTVATYKVYHSLIPLIIEGAQPIDVSFSFARIQGGLSKALGLNESSDMEESPTVEFSWTSMKESHLEDRLVDSVKSAFKRAALPYIKPVLYRNTHVSNGRKLLVYGDSMMDDSWQFPQFLAEHFEQVLILRLHDPIPEVEEMLHVTDVLMQTTERKIAVVLPYIEIP